MGDGWPYLTHCVIADGEFGRDGKQPCMYAAIIPGSHLGFLLAIKNSIKI
jgi:hypothetical protein